MRIQFLALLAISAAGCIGVSPGYHDTVYYPAPPRVHHAHYVRVYEAPRAQHHVYRASPARLYAPSHAQHRAYNHRRRD